MTTEAEAGVYPLSTPDGKAIPFDVGEPEGLFPIAFTTTVSASKSLPATYSIVTLYSEEACVVRFGGTAAITPDTNHTDAIIVPAGVPVSVKIPATSCTVIGVSASGTLFVQAFRRWQGLSTEILQTRIG